MKRCPHCLALVNPLRFLRDSPQRCRKCGGLSVHGDKWSDFHKVLTILVTAPSIGLLYETMPLFQRSTIWLIVANIALFVLVLVLADWIFGRMSPWPTEEKDFFAEETIRRAPTTLSGANSGEIVVQQRQKKKGSFARPGMADLSYLLVLAAYAVLAWMDDSRHRAWSWRDAVIQAGVMVVIVLGRRVGPQFAAVVPLPLVRVVILSATGLCALAATICGAAFLHLAWQSCVDKDRALLSIALILATVALVVAGAAWKRFARGLSTLGHNFGDVFWGSSCLGITWRGLELGYQFPELDACELPFEGLGDFFIVRLEFQESLGYGLEGREVVGREHFSLHD